MPSRDAPLTGSCACDSVAFEVTEPFTTAGYCHCKRCQRRSGALWALNAIVPAEGFEVVRGREYVRVWEPPDGLPKAFCALCGGQLYSDGGDSMVVRLGAIDADPGIRPEWHQWLESAPDWEPIPEDGLSRPAAAADVGKRSRDRSSRRSGTAAATSAKQQHRHPEAAAARESRCGGRPGR